MQPFERFGERYRADSKLGVGIKDSDPCGSARPINAENSRFGSLSALFTLLEFLGVQGMPIRLSTDMIDTSILECKEVLPNTVRNLDGGKAVQRMWLTRLEWSGRIRDAALLRRLGDIGL